MTNAHDFTTAYKRHQEALKTANALNKTEVFDALAAAGIGCRKGRTPLSATKY